jgi:hypothetical protein
MADSDAPQETQESQEPQVETPEEPKYTLTWEDTEGTPVTEEITEEQLARKAAALLETDAVTIGAEETRQIRQYEGNKYWMNARVTTSGLPVLIRSISPEVNAEMRKRANQVILNQLVLKIRGVFGFIKRNIHEQQRIDGVPHIDYRPGEQQQ